MIEIRRANYQDATHISLLGSVTYSESHGQYIDSKTDLQNYCSKAFSIPQIQSELQDPNILFWIVFVDQLPVGYAKLILNASHQSIDSKKACRLEKIYILNDFIAKKIGSQLKNVVVKKAQELNYDTMWLSVYVKNQKAIRFYLKNGFKDVGIINFIVGDKNYENKIFSKRIIE